MSKQADKAARVTGQAADSPGNDHLAPGRMREAPAGYIAAGHPHDPGTQMGYQAVRPAPGADLATVSGADGALASSIAQHQARVGVQVLDQARASAPGLFPQLSQPPGGIVSARQPGDHTAPVSAEPVRPRPGGPPAREYQRRPGELQGPG